MNSQPPDLFPHAIGKARDSVRPGLNLCQEFIHEIASVAPGQLKPRLEHILARKGKRIRATMLFILAQTTGRTHQEEQTRQARVAASLEMLHLASLVHDDVIDSSELRRGIFTANAEWGNKM
ncbi:MAG TPA: polyprenyl synthetase family protein, partial [Fibrobacteraceae bacterium]|nr:polyprenyl synthetase family protein [Fibrobacteraceae bacterium]